MVIQQEIDKRRNLYKNTLYSGKGFLQPKYFTTKNGGMLDSIIQSSKTPDLEQSILNTVKISKELENKKGGVIETKKKDKDYVFTPEQEENLKKLGAGFSTFSR